jgi:hypothetical protein
MIGTDLLHTIDLRCREGKPHDSNEFFGNLFVYFFRDFNQLPPVGDRPIYNESESEGRRVFKSFEKCVFLGKSFRQNINQEEEFCRV